MKLFKTPSGSLEALEERLGESRILAQLEHPNIVRIADANLIMREGLAYGYFTMEYVAGGSLDTYWRSYGSALMPIAEAVEIIRQVCRGLAVAHRCEPPLVHRDLKPQNILVGFDGAGLRVRVSDFGLAKAVSPVTLLVSARGTLSFKPPEALSSTDSAESDVWAVGTILYLLLTDRLPYPHLDARDLRDARRFLRPLRPPSIYNIEVDAALDAIVFRALAAEREDRYHDAADLLGDLDRWQPSLDPTTTMLPSLSEQIPESSMKRQDDPGSSIEETIAEAFRRAKVSGQLDAAADLLESALSRRAELRGRYGTRLLLWRRGIAM